MDKIKKIGFLGGTFNPIHNGHLMIARAAREYLALDQVILIPSGHSYMKAGIQMPDAALRLKMVRLAAADYPYFTVSDMEIRRTGNTYTYETAALLHAEYQPAELYFIAGADTVFTMETWAEPETIFRQMIIAAAVRDDKGSPEMYRQIAYLADKYHADIRLLPVGGMKLSSTEIRTRAAAGESIRHMVPEAVAEFIERHHIYAEDLVKK